MAASSAFDWPEQTNNSHGYLAVNLERRIKSGRSGRKYRNNRDFLNWDSDSERQPTEPRVVADYVFAPLLEAHYALNPLNRARVSGRRRVRGADSGKRLENKAGLVSFWIL